MHRAIAKDIVNAGQFQSHSYAHKLVRCSPVTSKAEVQSELELWYFFIPCELICYHVLSNQETERLRAGGEIERKKGRPGGGRGWKKEWER
jgi:hypothetical protein